MSRSMPRSSPPSAETWQSFVLFAVIMTVGMVLMFVIVLVA
jgi:hypothetical protein